MEHNTKVGLGIGLALLVVGGIAVAAASDAGTPPRHPGLATLRVFSGAGPRPIFLDGRVEAGRDEGAQGVLLVNLQPGPHSLRVGDKLAQITLVADAELAVDYDAWTQAVGNPASSGTFVAAAAASPGLAAVGQGAVGVSLAAQGVGRRGVATPAAAGALDGGAGPIFIRGMPHGGQAYLDGRPVSGTWDDGAMTLWAIPASPGRHKLRVVLGKYDRTCTVDVQPGLPLWVNVDAEGLWPDQWAPPAATRPPQDPRTGTAPPTPAAVWTRPPQDPRTGTAPPTPAAVWTAPPTPAAAWTAPPQNPRAAMTAIPLNPQGGAGPIFIRGMPHGGQAYLDGRPVSGTWDDGAMTLWAIPASPGRHKLRVVLGKYDRTCTVDVQPGLPLWVNVDAEGLWPDQWAPPAATRPPQDPRTGTAPPTPAAVWTRPPQDPRTGTAPPTPSPTTAIPRRPVKGLMPLDGMKARF